MSALGLIVAIAALAALFAGYYYSIRRLFEVPLTGIEVHPIYTPDGWRIVLYRHRRGTAQGEPVLLCHGFSANHWNLTLPRGVSAADYLAENGYDCWAIDFRGTRSSGPPPGTPRHRATFDGYVMEDLPSAIAYIREVTGRRQVHWVGHSLGGMLLYAYELANGREAIASGTTIASPPRLQAFWPKSQSRLIWVLERFPGAFSFVQRSLAPLHAWVKPRNRMVPIGWDNLVPQFGISEFFSSVETPPGPVTRTLEECARHQYLAVDNDRVNVLAGLNTLETPLLVFGCPLDPIVPVSHLREFFDRLPSEDKRYIELSRANGCSADYDHIDPPFAKYADTEVFEPIVDWLRAHPVKDAADVKHVAPARPKPIEPPRRKAAPATPVVAKQIEDEAEPEPFAPERVTEIETLVGASPVPGRGTSLWGRALEDAANILDDLDEDAGIPEPAELSAISESPRERRLAAKTNTALVGAKRGPTKKKAARKSTKTKAKTKPASRKPPGAAPGRISTKTKTKATTKKEAAAKTKTKSKKKSSDHQASESAKKDAGKKRKSKDKRGKKKSTKKKKSEK